MVSVIIPVYQVSDYVERCLKSVMSQTYTNIECIIVDDATMDDSIEKCEKLIEKYNGSILFRIIHHDVNRGLSAARNSGTNIAKGDYLYYLDGDDEITSDCIEKLLKPFVVDDSLEMVQGGYYSICDGKKELSYKLKSPICLMNNDDVRRSFLKYRILSNYVWNKLIKTSFVVEHALYCKEGVIYEDTLWMFYLIKVLRKVYIYNEVTYHYCIRPGSIVTGGDYKMAGESFYTIYNEILHNLTKGQEPDELKGYVHNFCKVYMTYVENVPSLNNTLRTYWECSKRHGCVKVNILLSIVRIIRNFGNPIIFLVPINELRWKFKRLFEYGRGFKSDKCLS